MYYDCYGDNMSSYKKVNDERGYRLMFTLEGRKKTSFCCYEASKIEEIDYFTSQFYDFNDMIEHISGISSRKNDVSFAYIERVGGKSKRYIILYRGNLFDYEKVVSEYTNYLLGNPNYFYKYSPVKSVNLCREDSQTYEDYVKKCCVAYFSKRNYRDIRGAYVELKNLGLAKRVVVPDTDFEKESVNDQIIFRDNEDLNKLLTGENGPDWDEIYSQFDLEDIARLMKSNPSRRGRK